MRQYQDKMSEVSTYRVVLLGIDVAVMIVTVLLIVILFPNINGLFLGLICLVLTVFIFFFQLHQDRYHVTSGQYLIDDGEDFYIIIPIFGLNLARRIRRQPIPKVRSFRYFWVEKVDAVTDHSFGIRLKAEGMTADYVDVHLEKEYFETPGKVREMLEEKGKKKTQVFHIEHNMMPGEERLMLARMEELKKGQDKEA